MPPGALGFSTLPSFVSDNSYLDDRKPRSNLCRRQTALGDKFYIFWVDEDSMNACGETGAAGDSEGGGAGVSNSARMSEKSFMW
jgi:hypothetical protein